MCGSEHRRRRRRELICECREVRSNRDDRDFRDRNREDEFRCECRECNPERSNNCC